MSQNPLQAIEAIAREKGIDMDVIVRAVEEAYAAASRKVLHSREDLGSRFDPETGGFEVFARKVVVPEVEDPDTEISLEDAIEIKESVELDEVLIFPRQQPELGRIAAQAAKQVIYQKVKEAERENVYNEYIDRVGEVINGIVKRFERGDMVVDLGRSEGAVPKREQSRAEHYNQGDRVRAVIVDVERAGKGPQVILSRTDPRLVMKLFEMEVPEIYDGTVRILSVGRDSGERTKIAVYSRDRDVDPVGACVGMKGSRVQSVIRELRGEKIDIVQFHENPVDFVREALKPAAINRVSVKDKDRREMEVIVGDDQLSLAIGKKGQNVRLGGRLVGWRIDIKSESEKRAEVDAEMEAVARARDEFASMGIEETLVARLIDAGFRSVGQLATADLEDLTRIPGVDEETALTIFDGAEVRAVELAEEAAKAAEEAAAAEALALEEAAAAEALALEEGEGEDGAEPGPPAQDEVNPPDAAVAETDPASVDVPTEADEPTNPETTDDSAEADEPEGPEKE